MCKLDSVTWVLCRNNIQPRHDTDCRAHQGRLSAAYVRPWRDDGEMDHVNRTWAGLKVRCADCRRLSSPCRTQKTVNHPLWSRAAGFGLDNSEIHSLVLGRVHSSPAPAGNMYTAASPQQWAGLESSLPLSQPADPSHPSDPVRLKLREQDGRCFNWRMDMKLFGVFGAKWEATATPAR